ncbi:MAG: hypothetical protein LBL76_02345 [Treponema sp.]|jgi:hypothetical protein|nr:hypothetical protein [Treponema sp.]
MNRFMLTGLWLLIPVVFLAAQEDDNAGFGFGFGNETAAVAAQPGVNVSGEVAALVLGFGDDFSSADSLKQASLGDIFSGKIKFAASAFNADGVINLNLAPVFDGSSPVHIDEAYIRLYIGAFTFEGGLRKLTWGKADTFGPLDVVNPLDYTDLTSMTDLLGMKIPRPLLHLSYRLGSFSALEGLVIPAFVGHRFAPNGRWAPAQFTRYPELMQSRIAQALAEHPGLIAPDGIQKIQEHYAQLDIASFYPRTFGLEYIQAGLRFTTTLGSSDLGIQYFYGNLFRPAITITGEADFIKDPYGIQPKLRYNRYHQIGVDYAQVIANFNLRAELAANITEDLSGDDGSVYNPAIAWSLGFDRDLVWGLKLNCQATESIRLMYSQIGDNPSLDTEAGLSMTSTRIIMALSRAFFRDALELKITGIWGIEDKDFYLIPALIFTHGDLEAELSGGILGGDEAGELGQYRKNSFVKAMLTYTF